MSDDTKDILTNKEVIAIDQDKLGKQGVRVRQDWRVGALEKGKLSDGVAVGLFNRSAAPAQMKVKWSEVASTRRRPKCAIFGRTRMWTRRASFQQKCRRTRGADASALEGFASSI